MEHAKVKSAIQNDVIKAIEFPLPSFKELAVEHKFQQIVKTDHLIHTLYWVISKNMWETLTKKQQQAITEAMQEAIQINNQYRIDEEIRLMEHYKKTMIITVPNLKAFYEQTESVFSDASFEHKDLVEKIKNL